MRPDRIALIIEGRFKGSRAAFSRELGKSQAQVSQWFSGVRPVGNGIARDIEIKFDLPRGWLDDNSALPSLDGMGNTAPVPIQHRYPVISYEQAARWTHKVGAFAHGHTQEWIASSEAVGQYAFWLSVTGDTMEPRFPEGAMILIDPDAAFDAGHFILARLGDDPKATFRRLTFDAGQWYLVPLNRQYQAMAIDRADVNVIGRVVYYQPRGESL